VARALSFARHLPAHGWKVTVVAADPASAPLRDESRADALPPEVEVHRVATPALFTRGRQAVIGPGSTRPTGLYRWAREMASWVLIPDSFAPWRKGAAAEAERLLAAGDFDAVLTTSPPDTVHLVGLDAVIDRSIPWVVDFRDPWIGISYKRPPTAWHASRQKNMRRSVLERADMILATTERLVESLRSLLPEGHKTLVHHLPNGWEDDVDPAEHRAQLDDGLLEIVYTGTLWDVPATRTCFTGLAHALGARDGGDGQTRLRVRIVGPHESREVGEVRQLGLGKIVQFDGQVPYAEARAAQSAADVLLLLQVHGEGFDVAVPGKLYEYVASAKPILAFLAAGEAADLVRESGGWVVDPDDVVGAAEAFASLLAGERPGGDSHTRRALADGYRRDRLVGRLAGFLDTLISGKPATKERA
jgi:glycosyltransferase involved in cell wall biosynthesis